MGSEVSKMDIDKYEIKDMYGRRTTRLSKDSCNNTKISYPFDPCFPGNAVLSILATDMYLLKT
jgi:hypothetical protein